jgi:hypothetical protein
MARQPLGGLGRLIFRGFTITLCRDTTLGRIPLDEWSARRRDLYLTTHNTHKRQTYMPPAGFEPAIPAGERPQTHALDGTAIAIGLISYGRTYIRQSRRQACNLLLCDFTVFLPLHHVLLGHAVSSRGKVTWHLQTGIAHHLPIPPSSHGTINIYQSSLRTNPKIQKYKGKVMPIHEGV